MTNPDTDDIRKTGSPEARQPDATLKLQKILANAVNELTRLVPHGKVLILGDNQGMLAEALIQAGFDVVVLPSDPVRKAFARNEDWQQTLAASPDLVIWTQPNIFLTHDDTTDLIADLALHVEKVLLFSSRGADAGSLHAGQWAERFAPQGFFRDLSFKPSFSGILFQRHANRSLEAVVVRYEKALDEARRTNVLLRAQQDTTLHELELARKGHDPLIRSLETRIAQWESVWEDQQKSIGWNLLVRFREQLVRIAPPGSRRSAFLRNVRDSVVILFTLGFKAFYQHLSARPPAEENTVFFVGKTLEQRNADAYADFVARNVLSARALKKQRKAAAAWSDAPLISFITPVYQPPADVLTAMLDSVLAQTYPHWELCIADASLESPATRTLLQTYADRDSRIRLHLMEANEGICGNSNAALEMARGEYIAILDHDDVIEPDMLFEVVRHVRSRPDADVIYFDEDKLSADGEVRRDPFFKPDFSPEMLISANYLTHAVYRRELVEAVGGFDPEFEGCQDWDLAFKVTERSSYVAHIPRVLYHWRQVSGSTAGDFQAKAYVFERQLLCVQNHLDRVGLKDVRTSFPVPGFLRASWAIPGRKVSIIIPSKEKVGFLRQSIESIFQKTDYPDYEIVIVDNGSRENATLAYYEKLRGDDRVRIVDYTERFNYSRANNVGAAHAEGEIFLFLNNDIQVLHPEWLTEMVQWAERPEVGVVGAKLLYPDNTIQHAGVVIGMEGHASHVFWGYRERQSGPFGSVDWYRNYMAVTGACMMIRRDTFEEIGGFSERYELAFSDTEICKRAFDRGYRVVFTPFSRLYHFEGKSRGSHIPSLDIRIGIEDFVSLVASGDPYYNPNLSYSVRQPLVVGENEEMRLDRLRRIGAAANADDRIFLELEEKSYD